MGFRFRKSIKLGKGVRLNLSKRGVGMSFGIPGTGISYSTNSGRKRKRKSSYKVTSEPKPKKPMRKGLVPFLLTIFLGWCGGHWFFSGRIGMGFLYLCTFGLLGFGWLFDIIRQSVALVKMIAAEKKASNE